MNTRIPDHFPQNPHTQDGPICPDCLNDSIVERYWGVFCSRCGWQMSREEIREQEDNRVP